MLDGATRLSFHLIHVNLWPADTLAYEQSRWLEQAGIMLRVHISLDEFY